MKNDITISSNPDCTYCGGDDVIIDVDSFELKVEPCPLCLPEYKVT